MWRACLLVVGFVLIAATAASPSGGADMPSAAVSPPDVDFVQGPTLPLGSRPVSLRAADLNGDGLSDLVAADPPFDRVLVILGMANGGFTATALYPAGDDPGSIAVGDLNGDDLPDLAVTNADADMVSVLLNVNGGFPTVTSYPVGDIPTSVAIGDVNGDGHPDLAVTNINDGTLWVLHNNGAGVFVTGQTLVLGSPGGVNSVKIGDLDGDGHGDLAVARPAARDVALLFGDGSGTFAFVVPYVIGNSPRTVELVDINTDGLLDIVVIGSCGGGCSRRDIVLNAGGGAFSEKLTDLFGPTQASVVFADFNGDATVDIATAFLWEDNTHTIGVYVNDGFERFDLRKTISTGDPSSLAVADFNRDGAPDLAAASNDNGNVVLWFNRPVPDTEPPSLTIAVDPADQVAASGWYSASSSGTDGVKVNVVASDNRAVASVTCTDNGTEVLNTSDTSASFVVTDGVHAVACTASDGANSTPATLGVSVDQTAPSIVGQVDPNPVVLGGSAAANFAVEDATSGAGSGQCGTPDTATPGIKSIACVASDLAGNTAQTSLGYTVAFGFGGVQEPIPQSSYKAGSTIPVKFTLTDHASAPIPDTDAQALVARCLIRVSLDGVQQSGCVQYSARLDQFQYNLKLPKALTGTHVLTIKVAAPDGSGVVNASSVTIILRR
jgi:VCBS repeat protein